MNFQKLVKALPDRFSFYHLGEVELIPEESSEGNIAHSEDLLAQMLESGSQLIGLSFSGDLRGLILICVDKSLDLSTYMEMANIIASRMATKLADEEDMDVLISPPRTVQAHLVRGLIHSDQPKIRRTYFHQNQGTVIPVHAWILPVPWEGTGHA